MKKLLFILAILSVHICHSHRGEILAIEHVDYYEISNQLIFSFDIENIKEQNIAGVRIEFMLNGESIEQHDFELIRSDEKWVKDEFIFSSDSFDPEKDLIQIEITHIFSKKFDWGGWDGPAFQEKQTNTLYSEFYADAPWRMKREDGNGNDYDVPVHFFLHDADLVVGYTMKIDYIDIKVKNPDTNTFGSILTFDSLSSNDFQSYFSCVSPDDPVLNAQEFDLTAFTATSSHTIDFDGESDFIDDFVSVDATYWYFTINLPGSIFEGMDNVIDIEATISYANILIPDDDVIRMRIFRSDDDIPTQTGFYRGDTHLHSVYTQNDAEIGLPLCSTKEASKLIGLDWVTTTDHTSDFDNYGNGNINDNWVLIQNEANVLNAQDSTFIYIAGQEVAANNSNAELIHMLVYPSYNDPFSLPFLGDGDGDLSATSVSIDDVVNNMATVDGFSYCSHPFATGDKLPDFPVNGGIWNLGHIGFPLNGDNFPLTGGNIICNDDGVASDVLSASPNEMVKEGIRGSQIWNLRWSLEVGGLSGDQLDPFDVTNSGSPLSQTDTADYGFHLKRFRQGQEIVNFINQLGLSMKNSDPAIINWKMYYSAGSDAHGSFNSSNTDDFGGTGDMHNNAVGKLSTLTYCPGGMGTDGTEILRSLYNGSTTLSDGPILTIGISTNGDDGNHEVLMGEDAVLNYNDSSNIYLNFNYTTTNEFGDVQWIKLYVGTELGEEVININPDYLNGNHQKSLNLMALLENNMINVPVGEYFYLRAELQTFRDYSAMLNTYRTDFDYFHSFTNPIWINWDVNATVPELDNKLSVYPNPFNQEFFVQLNDFNLIESIVIYDPLGKVIYTKQPLKNLFVINLLHYSTGLYFVEFIGKDGSKVTHKLVKD